jgi:hypothetical protein
VNTFKEILERLVKEFIGLSKRYPAGQELEEIAKKAQQMFDEQKITSTVVDERKLPKAEIKALPLKDKEKAEAAVKKKIEAQNIQAQQSLRGGESQGAQRGRPEAVDENYGQTVFIDKSEMMMIMDDAAKKFDQARDAVARGDYDEARAILRYEIEDNYKLPQETRNAAYDARVFIRRGEGIDPKEMGYETVEETIEALDEQITKGMKTTMEDNWPLYTAPDDTSKMKNIEYVNFLDEPGEDFGTPNSIMKTPSDIDYEYADGGRVGFKNGTKKIKPIPLPDPLEEMLKNMTKEEREEFERIMKNNAKNFFIEPSEEESEFLKIKQKRDEEYKKKHGIPDEIELFNTGGRVGFARGSGIITILNQLLKSKKMGADEVAQLIDLVKQAEKAGIPINTLKDLENFKSQIEEAGGKIYESRKKYPGVGKEKSGLPSVSIGEAPKTNLKKVRAQKKSDEEGIKSLAESKQIPVKQGEVLEDGTPDYEYYEEILNDSENDFVKGTETIEELEAMVKEKDDYMKYMYGQYKAGKLGSKIGDDVKNISDTEIAKAYRQAREGNDLDLSDDKYDAQIVAEYLSDNLYKTEFSDLPQDAQLDLYDRAYTFLMEDKMEKAMQKAKPMKGPIDMKTGKNIITGEKVIDDDPGMFDNLFDKMQKQMQDYIPGEEPLTPSVKKTPRKDNAKGGLNYLLGF